MSYLWKMVCHETKKEVFIGQGYREMSNFWTTEKEDMDRFRRFLLAHAGKPLEFVGQDWLDERYDRFT
jgi:hypothetical protein